MVMKKTIIKWIYFLVDQYSGLKPLMLKKLCHSILSFNLHYRLFHKPPWAVKLRNIKGDENIASKINNVKFRLTNPEMNYQYHFAVLLWSLQKIMGEKSTCTVSDYAEE